MTNDKTYCIRSNKFIEKYCTNTNCDRHEKNEPVNGGNHRQWVNFDECNDYRTKDVEIICRIGNCLDCSPAIAESIYEKADELSLETKYSMERVTNDICKIYRVYGYEFLIDMTGDAYLGVIYDLSNK